MAKTSTAKDKKSTKKKADPTPAAEAVRQVAKKARVLANNPVVTEIVAATLVAAAAALKNPAKARALADSAADELKEASKGATAGTGAIWQLAMDVARRSVEAIGTEAKKDERAKPKAASKAEKAGKASKPAKVKKVKKAKKAARSA